MEIDFSKFEQWGPDEVPAIPPDPLEACIIDLTKDYPPVDFLLQNKDGIGCIPRGNLIAIKGKAKQGKSYVCACLETAMLKGHSFGFTATKEGLKVLHIDTEQNTLNVAGRAKIVHALAGWNVKVNNPRFVLVALEEFTTADRLNLTKEAIKRHKPDCVVIDGIRDLCSDFNDIAESANLIGELMRLRSLHNCAILCILHENKADGNMRGHLGTELLNKCSETYQIAKDKNGDIVVEQTECRNAPAGKWSICIDEAGTPQLLETVSRVDVKREELADTFRSIFSRNPKRQYSELVREYVETAGRGERTAKTRISEALAANIIHKQADGSYTFGDFPDERGVSALEDDDDLL